MANTVNSTNMAMPVPVVGVDPGPTYATDLNTCLGIVDSHDHTVGNGVKITPSGMNITSDLSFNSTSSAIALYKAVFTSQSVALTGTNFLSFIGGNLYVNDSSGNQIAITSGGGVAGSPGSIGSLASPAAATYSAGSKLFTWTSAATKAAAMDNGAVTIRETDVASAKGITIKSPTSLAADYNLTLFAALPGSAMYVSCDSSGNLGNVSADTIGAAMTSTGSNAISVARTRATGTTVAAGGVAISTSSGGFSSTSASMTDVTGLSVTITTSGRPVQIVLVPDNSASQSRIGAVSTGAARSIAFNIQLVKSGTASDTFLSVVSMTADNTGATLIINVPASSLSLIDPVSIGTYTYKVQVQAISATTTVTVGFCKLVAYEL